MSHICPFGIGKFNIKVTISGIKPLLQNNHFVQNFDINNYGTLEEFREEARSRLIVNENGMICQPAKHIKASLVESSSDFKSGDNYDNKRAVMSSVTVIPDLIEHEFQHYEIDKQYVTISGAKQIRCRPRIFPWKLSFEIELIKNSIGSNNLHSILINAGKIYGIGDYRPEYGLFEVQNFHVVSIYDLY